MRRSTLIFLILLAAVVVVRLWIFHPANAEKGDPVSARSLYAEVSRLIDEHYVDPVDPEKAWPGAYGAMLQKLDPFGSYIPPDLVPAARSWRQGRGFWAGIWVFPTEQGFRVSRILPGSPAARSALLVGDIVKSIDNTGLTGRTWEEVRLLLYTFTEKTFLLAVNRADVIDPLEIVLPAIPMFPDVEFHQLSHSTIHLELMRLTPAAVRAVSELFQSLPGRNWIVDLRNYQDGELGACLSLADLLLPPVSRLTLHTRSGAQRIRAGKLDAAHPHMTVVIGPATIMYGEILARFMQSAGTTLVGEKSGGFSASLRRIPLPDGGELMIADGFFHWDGKNIRYESLTPDVSVSGHDAALSMAQSMLKEG